MGEGLLTASDGVLSRIVREVGTPTYVYDAEAIRTQYGRLRRALGKVPHRIHYSIKANSNLAILGILRGLGSGADIVSGGELRRALAAGFDPEHVVFSGVGKTRAELDDAICAGVGLINLESDAEFDLVVDVARGRPVAVGIRVNPDVTTETHPHTQTGQKGMKFGVPLDRVMGLTERIAAANGIRLVSIGMHIGSQIANVEHYREGAVKLAALVERLREVGVGTLSSVDVGGGLAVSHDGGQGLDPEAFAEAVAPLHRTTGLTLLTEPGRFLVGNAGCLVTRVLYRKQTGGRTFVIVDTGMNDFVRPSLYGARHALRVIEAGAPGADTGAVDVVGPICETGDYLARDVEMAPVGAGGVVAILGTGAYGFSMSSTYNSRPRPAEVLVDGERIGVVRRREAVEELWRGEVAEPEWWA